MPQIHPRFSGALEAANTNFGHLPTSFPRRFCHLRDHPLSRWRSLDPNSFLHPLHNFHRLMLPLIDLHRLRRHHARAIFSSFGRRF